MSLRNLITSLSFMLIRKIRNKRVEHHKKIKIYKFII